MNMNKLISQIHEDAQQLGACARFKGDETLEELISLFYSPQGREFCMTHEFPSLDVLRKFRKYDIGQYGIYIDAGVIRLRERVNLFLMGNTTASVTCSQTKRYVVYLMHGAHARIEAHDYAVVHVERDDASSVSVELYDNAREI